MAKKTISVSVEEKLKALYDLQCVDSEIDQLFRIFRTKGTPTEQIWPGVGKLPDMKDKFPRWTPQNLARIVSRLNDKGTDLFSQMLIFSPSKRITASKALRHPYFLE